VGLIQEGQAGGGSGAQLVTVGGKNIILRVEERVDLAGYCCVMGSCSGLDPAWRAGREKACARLSFRGRRVNRSGLKVFPASSAAVGKNGSQIGSTI